MTGETVCIGAIGAGAISEYHLAGLQAAGGADVRVISGRHTERIVPVAEKYGIPDVVTDYRAVLDRDDVNAVIITTPENTHEEIAVAAARAGKAILLQKPIADSADACERIIQATIRAGVSLQVSFMHRYFEEVVYARDLLRSGELGDLHAIRMRNATPGPDKAWYYNSAIAAGGVVFSLGVHGIDLIQHLFGAIDSVAARTATMVRERTMLDGETVRNIELEDHALASYCLANGVLGSHEMSACEVQGTDRFLLEIYCEKGTMVLRGHRGPLAICAPQVRGTSVWITPDLPQSSFGARHHVHWLDIVRGASRADATAWDALAGMRVVEAIYAAAESGARISVPAVKDADYAS